MSDTGAAGAVVTIVVAARNDNYGDTFSARFQTFLRHLSSLEARHKALFDLIVVEWNPPPDRPPMSDAFNWAGLPQCRLVTVSADIHASIPIPGYSPMLEFMAKNVGIRRATTPFVLSTNPDVLLAPAFFDLLQTTTLDTQAFYRADRYDLAPDIVFDAPSDQIFPLAQQAIFEVHTRNTVDPEEPMSHFVDPARPVDQWPQSQPIYGDTLSPDGAMILSGKRRDAISGLHTQASGDFIMASKQAWEAVRGHWERTDTYAHLDSYLVCHFHAAGFEQRILRRPVIVLHMDHSRDDHRLRPTRPYPEIAAEIRRAAEGKLPNPNDENWGLANLDLPEAHPKQAKSAPHSSEPAAKRASAAATLTRLSRVYALAAAQRTEDMRKRRTLELQVTQLKELVEIVSDEKASLQRALQNADEISQIDQRARDAAAELEKELEKSQADLASSRQLAEVRAREVRALQKSLSRTEANATAQADVSAKGDAALAEEKRLSQERADQIAELQNRLAQAEMNAAAQADAALAAAQQLSQDHALQLAALQSRLTQLESDAIAQADAAMATAQQLAQNHADQLSTLQDRLAQVESHAAQQALAHTEAIAQADAAVAAAHELAQSHANQLSILQNSLTQGESNAVALQALLESITQERDQLQRALAAERDKLAVEREQAEALSQRVAQLQAEADDALMASRQLAQDHANQLNVLQNSLAQVEHSAAATKAELQSVALERDDLEKIIATERNKSAIERGEIEILNQRIAQLRAEADDAQTALREANRTHTSERAVADARYDEVIRLLGVARSEEIAQIRAAYDQRIAQLIAAMEEVEQVAGQLDAERVARQQEVDRLNQLLEDERAAYRTEAERSARQLEAQRETAESAQQLARESADNERTRREAAEGILIALEDEGVQREQRVAALQIALAEAQRAAAEATAARDAAATTYKAIVENSRYLKTRRALLRLLGRSSDV